MTPVLVALSNVGPGVVPDVQLFIALVLDAVVLEVLELVSVEQWVTQIRRKLSTDETRPPNI